MKISTQEQKVLAAISEIGEVPIPKLAKHVGYREHSVRYALSNLIKREVVRYFPCINACALGYIAFTVYFSLASSRPQERARLIKYLLESNMTSWLAEFVGDYQYATKVFVRHTSELDSFLDSLSSISKGCFSEMAVRVEFESTYFPLKYFGNPARQSIFVVWGGGSTIVSIEPIDRKILAALARSQGSSGATLARKVGLPATTLEYRLKKLEQQKVIVGHTYFLNTEKIGLLTFKALIYTRGSDRSLSERLLEFARSHPSITLFVRCAGAWEYEMNADYNNTTSILELVEELYSRFGSYISNIRTMQLLRHVKAQEFPFDD